ncbi:MAG: glyoxalase [Acidobacteria bacterium]|nr:MAG: glyoxalase [Acidobacteriota bacterium]
MSKDGKIDYLEFPSSDITKTKQFFEKVFGWSFKDYGDDYTCFFNQGLNGGIYRSEKVAAVEKGSTLAVLYSQNLEETQAKVEKAGGRTVKEIFSFPGGRRFHFSEPGGSEFAVWSDIEKGSC